MNKGKEKNTKVQRYSNLDCKTKVFSILMEKLVSPVYVSKLQNIFKNSTTIFQGVYSYRP